MIPQTPLQFGAILGPKNAELMCLGPKWGYEKSWEKPRLATVA